MTLIISLFCEFFAMLFMLRFYMRFCLVGGNAPLATLIAKITNPLTRLFNPFLPKIGNIDLAAILLAFGLLVLQAYSLSSLPLVNSVVDGQSALTMNTLDVFLYAAVKLLKLFLDLIFFAILGTVILSWVSPNSPNPISIQLLYPMTDWILQPVRRIIPTVGMIDFSPLLVLLALQFIENFLVNNILT